MRQRLGIGRVAFLTLLTLFVTVSAARADYTTTVNPSVTWGISQVLLSDIPCTNINKRFRVPDFGCEQLLTQQLCRPNL